MPLAYCQAVIQKVPSGRLKQLSERFAAGKYEDLQLDRWKIFPVSHSGHPHQPLIHLSHSRGEDSLAMPD